MCFYIDADWNAEVHDEKDGVAGCPMKCQECHSPIANGAFVHSIFQQEHEECQTCYSGDCDCGSEDGTDCCSCDEPDHGEEFSYVRCEECHKFLAAVKAAELAAGCDESESLPPYEMMDEYICNGGAGEARKYFQEALRTFPELKASGYLGSLWNRMFVQ